MATHKMNGEIESIMGSSGYLFRRTNDELRELYQHSVITSNKRNVASRLFAYATHPDTHPNVRIELLNLIRNKPLIGKVVLVADRSAFLCTPWVFRDRIEYCGQSFEEATCIAMYLNCQTWEEKVNEDREWSIMYEDDYDDIEEYEEEAYEYEHN